MLKLKLNDVKTEMIDIDMKNVEYDHTNNYVMVTDWMNAFYDEKFSPSFSLTLEDTPKLFEVATRVDKVCNDFCDLKNPIVKESKGKHYMRFKITEQVRCFDKDKGNKETKIDSKTLKNKEYRFVFKPSLYTYKGTNGSKLKLIQVIFKNREQQITECMFD